MNMSALIMAGGVGTRFWPLSTQQKPKQYIKLFGEQSLLHKTFDRIAPLIAKEQRFVVSTKNQKELLKAYGDYFPLQSNLFLEPSGRNTAPCIFLSLVRLRNRKIPENQLLIVLPADHYIPDQSLFLQELKVAAAHALAHAKLVLMGITPNKPCSGYGHIQMGDVLDNKIHKIEKFIEKPKPPLDAELFHSGKYLWNAGIFVGTLSSWWEHYRDYAPDYLPFELPLAENDERAYEQLQAISVDYKIMEKSKHIAVMKTSFAWNDLGSYDALENMDVFTSSDGNTLLTPSSLYTSNATGNIVSTEGKEIALIDVHDLVIIESGGKILITHKQSSQKVKSAAEFFSPQNSPKL